MKIFLIRHGESVGNSLGIHQGQKNDSPLSEIGRKQANCLRDRFENIKIDAIYSSDLIRAKETAEIISKPRGITPILDKRLRERNFGLIEEEKDIMKAWNNFLKQQVEMGINQREATPKEGESDKDHFDRVKSFFEYLKKNHDKKETILVVAHGGTNKVAFGVTGYFSLEEMYKTPQGNTCVNELVFEKGKWKVNKINCMKHLKINQGIIKEFEKIRNEPLDIIKNRCWEKNLKLKNVFEKMNYKAKPAICSFKWSEQIIPKDILNLPHEDLDYYMYLIVKINGLKLIVDASNDSLLPNYNSWDGQNNCNLNINPKEFIEENIEDIINKKLNDKYSKNQLIFLEKINSFFDELRKKIILKDKKG